MKIKTKYISGLLFIAAGAVLAYFRLNNEFLISECIGVGIILKQ